MDVVSLHNHDIKNVCASLGTAITDNQINLAWRNFKNIIICFDGDKSGFAAAYRAAEKLIKISKANHTVSFMIMPQGLDPDDYVGKFGKDGFNSLVKKKKDITEFVFEYATKQLQDYSVSSLADLEKRLMDIADTIEDVIIKKYYKGFFKNKIFENLIKKNKNKLNKFQISSKIDVDRLEMSELEVKEFSFCQLLIKFPELLEKNIERISEIDLSLELTKKIRSTILDISLNGDNCNHEKMKEILLGANIQNINTFLKFVDANSFMTNVDADTFVNLIEDYELQLKKIQKDKKIEELEKSFSSNMSEQALNELISLKNSNNL